MNPGGIGKLKGVLSLGTPIFFKGPTKATQILTQPIKYNLI